jgi:hypothetical protein
MSEIEARLAALEKSVALMQLGVKRQSDALGKIPETISSVATASAGAQIKMSMELSGAVGIAVEQMTQQAKIDLNPVILVVEEFVEMRQKSGCPEGELVLVEAFLSALRLAQR